MTSSSPLVTVLMPVYNGEQYLGQAIESILNQTFTDFEFLIIDDASTDNSIEIIKNYRDNRIQLVENNQNLGQAETMNTALGLAMGNYIARMDQDDISLDQRLEKQVYYLQKFTKVGILGCHVRSVKENLAQVKPIRNRPLTNYTNQWRLLYSTSVMHSSVMFRKELYLKHGGYYARYSPAEDYEYWSRLSQNTEIHQLPDVLVLIRRHAFRSSVNRKSEQLEMKEKITRGNINRLLSNHINPNEVNDLSYYFSGGRHEIDQWWISVGSALINMYRVFCFGKSLTNKEIIWISKDLGKQFSDIPLRFKLTVLAKHHNSFNFNDLKTYFFFRMFIECIFLPCLKVIKIKGITRKKALLYY